MFIEADKGVKIIRDIQISFSHLKNSYSSVASVYFRVGGVLSRSESIREQDI